MAWFYRLSTTLAQLGFSGSKTDPSLFIFNSGGTLVYVLVYVNDIIITGNNQSTIYRVIHNLSSTFAIKDLGRFHYFLGIKVVHHQQNLVLSQQKYILDILQRSSLSNCKPVSSLMSSSHPLTINDSPPLLDRTIYCQTVGALQYATLSRPDIAFVVNRVCQFMHAPMEDHWSAVKRILKRHERPRPLASSSARLLSTGLHRRSLTKLGHISCSSLFRLRLGWFPSRTMIHSRIFHLFGIESCLLDCPQTKDSFKIIYSI